jgi:GT2 family glycosyltransferase
MSAQPWFSIIIPTYNRPRPLADCLQALTRLNYPRDRFEVIVVDDGSATATETVIAAFRNRLSVTMVKQQRNGPASARNLGAAQAKGRFLAFTDDDCAPTPDWLRAFAARFAVAPNHAIGGRTVNALPDNLYATASQMLVTYLYAYYNAEPGQARFLASNNLAIPADRFQTVGGFDAVFRTAGAEDREFCDRWRHLGYQMTSAPEALIMHAHAMTFRGFVHQHFNYGCGAFICHQLHARRAQKRIKMEPLIFYVNLLRFPFLQVLGWRASVLSMLLAVAQVANASGFFWQRAAGGGALEDPNSRSSR